MDRRVWLKLATLIGTVATSAIGCSASSQGPNRASDSAEQGGSSGGGAGGALGGSGGVGFGGAGGSVQIDSGNSGGTGSGGLPGDACAGETRRGETLPIDLFIMFDQSASMDQAAGNVSRWIAVTGATRDFIQSPNSAGIGVGIQYFGRGIFNEDCNPATYGQPDVPIGPLPGNAPALVASLNQHQPSTETPTTAALQGAIGFARQWKTSHPGNTIAVLLVTDGVPETPASALNPASTCVQNPQTIQATAQAAADGAGNVPQIPTYVLGVGPNLANLDQIAAAGGTQHAYLFDGSQNVSQAVLDALNTIRGIAAIPCELQIPQPGAGQTLDLGQVNVTYTPDGSGPQTIYNVADAAQCNPAAGGWYYDNPAQPTKIVLCPASCDVVASVTTGQLDVLLGCETVSAPPR